MPGGDQAQAARHAEVQDQVAVAAIEQQVFAAPRDRAHSRPGERAHRVRNRPAQARLAHRDRGDRAADEVGRDAAAGDFDFGEFRHRAAYPLVLLCVAPNIPTLTAPCPLLPTAGAPSPRRFSPQASCCGGAQAQQLPDPDDDDDDAPSARCAPRPAAANLPLQDLTGQTLYDFLLGEIAAQRGSPGFAAQTFLDLAKRTRDPRVARRAVEVANFARMPELALESARIWHETDPASPQALQTVVVLLVGAKRVDEAEPYLAKLLAIDANAAANGFMQLGRLLAGNPDPAANLRVVRKLAERYPNLPQAHFAVAQAAARRTTKRSRSAEAAPGRGAAPGLGDRRDVRGAAAAAALARRGGQAPRRVPREVSRIRATCGSTTRACWCSTSATRKRAPSSSRFLKRFPKDIDAIYAVGLLAFQVKEYAVAEANMKRLLELGYRDPNAVRYTLGQIAEEQKDWPRAIEWYKTIQRGEQALPARMRTANAIAKQGKLDEARAYLRGVRRAGRTAARAAAGGRVAAAARREPAREAFDLLGEALQKSPDQPDLLYDHALTAEKLDRFDVLESSLKRLIQLKPDHAHAYNALGYSFAERNMRLPEAKQLIEKALELAPDGFLHHRLAGLGAVPHGRPEGRRARAAPRLGRPSRRRDRRAPGRSAVGARRARRGAAHLAGSAQGQPRERDAAKDAQAFQSLTSWRIAAPHRA